MVLPVSFLSRRNLMIGEGARRLHRSKLNYGLTDNHLPSMALTAISIQKALIHLKKLKETPQWSPIKETLYVQLTEAFDTAVSEIPDEELKDLFTAEKIMYTYE